MKMQCYLLAFIDSSLRVIDDDLLSKIVQYVLRHVFGCFHCYHDQYMIIGFTASFTMRLCQKRIFELKTL